MRFRPFVPLRETFSPMISDANMPGEAAHASVVERAFGSSRMSLKDLFLGPFTSR